MRIAIDTHTHSVASGHAYSTIDQLAEGARLRGLEGFVLTDHGPALPGGPHKYHFFNLRVLPDYIAGVRVYRGIEANILDSCGTLDFDEQLATRLDFVMAGFHEICMSPQNLIVHTEALLMAMENPYLVAISHPGNPVYPIDQVAVVRRAAELGKALEINDSSFRIRKGSSETCLALAKLGTKFGCPVVCGSDAHYWGDVGRFDTALSVITKAGIDQKQLVNADKQRFDAFILHHSTLRIGI